MLLEASSVSQSVIQAGKQDLRKYIVRMKYDVV